MVELRQRHTNAIDIKTASGLTTRLLTATKPQYGKYAAAATRVLYVSCFFDNLLTGSGSVGAIFKHARALAAFACLCVCFFTKYAKEIQK